MSIHKGSVSVSETTFEPVAHTPIEPAPPVVVMAGWRVSGRRSMAVLTLTDCTPLAKVQLKAPEAGPAAAAVGVAHLTARRDDHGALVTGSGPGEWLVLAPPDRTEDVVARYTARLQASDEFHSVMALTHGRALLRLTGESAAAVLAKVCGIDLADAATPDGAALRTSVARVVSDLVRDDQGTTPSYLLHCETSSGQFLFDSLLDAGEEFGVDVDGFTLPGI